MNPPTNNMDTMTNFDHFDAPKLEFSAFPDGMAEKVQVGDTITAKEGLDETEAKVIEVDKEKGCIYLSKELPTGNNVEYVVKETSTGDEAPYEAMKKAVHAPKEDVLTGPLPDLKKFLISIQIEEK